MKICCTCRQIKPFSAFSKNRSRKDGLKCYCNVCQKTFNKLYHQTKKGKKAIRKAKNHFHIRHPERRKARQAVRDAITAGRLARPDLLSCRICKEHATEYHHNSYLPKDKLVVFPVCQKCHSKIHRKIA